MQDRWFDDYLRSKSPKLKWTTAGAKEAGRLLFEIARANGAEIAGDPGINDEERRAFALGRLEGTLHRFGGSDLFEVEREGVLIGELSRLLGTVKRAPFGFLQYAGFTPAEDYHVYRAFEARAAEIVREGASAPVRILFGAQYSRELLNRLNAAAKSIVVVAFYFRLRPGRKYPTNEIADSLVEAHRRGVKVRIVLDASVGRGGNSRAVNQQARRFFESNGIEVAFLPERRTHRKLVVVDQTTIFTGSHNLTAGSLRAYDEVSLLIESPSLASRYEHQTISKTEIKRQQDGTF